MGNSKTTVQNLSSLLLATMLVVSTAADAADKLPFADIHLHYKWSQAEVTSKAEAIAAMQRNNVVLAVVSSTPPELALELADTAGDWMIPLYQPYLDAGGRYRWYLDKRVPAATRQALASGRYHGIGEIHLTAGVGPKLDNPILNELLKLAVEFDAPVLIHTEAANEKYLLAICQAHPQTRFLWAHAGGLVGAEAAQRLMSQCRNVWLDFSARDKWKYANYPIVDEQGHLLPGWRNLVQLYPDRFMTGSDPIWPVEFRDNWDTPDTGWDMMDELIEFHRRWLGALPADLAEKIRLRNAQAFFRLPPANR
jgi:predicted TIM-barrel fold metal-dependent hydrolase